MPQLKYRVAPGELRVQSIFGAQEKLSSRTRQMISIHQLEEGTNGATIVAEEPLVEVIDKEREVKVAVEPALNAARKAI